MELNGKLKKIEEVKTFGANGFRKREVVLVTDEQYPQSILVEFTQDRCDLLDQFQEGQNVKISINIRGREWVNPEGKTIYFNSINGWRIEGVQENQAPEMPPMPPIESLESPSDDDKNEPDDLPF